MWKFLSTIWKPVVEVAVLSVGIYYVFKSFRGTRGAPVVYGFVIFLLSLIILAKILNLAVLDWIFRSFATFAAFAVLVIFQPELRRILAELGTRPMFATVREQRENIEVIVQTVERLADVKIGALMAIEQTIQLQDIVESGIVVDCEATPEMLETIFFPNNAIHDGGVILQGDRVAYAACIFPLTQRQDLNPSLGTRHRAAIGLSEETDAIVVVVSEETGSIGYAYKGQLVRGVSAEKLRAFLSSVLVSRGRSRTFQDWIRTRLGQRFNAVSAAAAKMKSESEAK
ncbi:MAG: TIGR00159 family protein [Verrucomicrobia bacterium]|nr:TIGR00159 family protein [Verrucomicrobiota bacterium]